MKFDFIDRLNWEKMGGLIPVIVQESESLVLLMQAYVNKEALQKTIETGYAHYFSRSRNEIWKKGETSGHIQKIIKIFVDCDSDCLLYLVKQKGVACHTGAESCFFTLVYGNDEE